MDQQVKCYRDKAWEAEQAVWHVMVGRSAADRGKSVDEESFVDID